MKTYSKMTKRVALALTLSCCILFTGNVQALTDCSYGNYNCNVQNMNEQAAMKAEQERIDAENANRAAASNNVESTPVYTSPRASQFGAVALNSKTGAVGMANNLASKSSAKRAALADCGESGCHIIGAYANTCMALVYGTPSGRSYLRTEPSSSLSEASALSACSAENSNCQIFYSECSLP